MWDRSKLKPRMNARRLLSMNVLQWLLRSNGAFPVASQAQQPITYKDSNTAFPLLIRSWERSTGIVYRLDKLKTPLMCKPHTSGISSFVKTAFCHIQYSEGANRHSRLVTCHVSGTVDHVSSRSTLERFAALVISLPSSAKTGASGHLTLTLTRCTVL